jgi:uncharacterized protein with HEPN domain/predicted nucleotidyltransferase
MPINTPAELEAKLIELSPMLHDKFNVSKIGYFGSFARNEQTETSDIDLILESPDSLDRWTLKEELAPIFGRKVDVVVNGQVLPELRESIMEDVRFLDGNIIVGASFPQQGDKRFMKQKRCDIYLKDILNALQKIKTKTANQDFQSFIADEDVCMIVERCFTVIGEAAGKVSQSIRDKYPEISWTSMIGLRNIVVHDYDGIRYDKIWEIIQNDVSKNIVDLERILQLEEIDFSNEH